MIYGSSKGGREGRRGFFQSRSEMGSPSRQIITNVISNLFSSVQRGASIIRPSWKDYRVYGGSVIMRFVSVKSTVASWPREARGKKK